MIHINDLVSQLEAHRVHFIDGRDRYIAYVFELSCRELELRGYRPSEELQALGMGMRAYVYEDLQLAKQCYAETNKIIKWWTPDSKEIDAYLRNKQKYLTHANKGL